MKVEKKILVRGVNWIGDAVMTLPALRAIRSASTGAEIHLMVKKWVAQLFEIDPNVDAIVEYKKEFSGIIGKFKASRILKKTSYDSAILLQNAFDAAILAYLSGIPERLGYSLEVRGILLSKAISVTAKEKSLHHSLYYLNLLREAGIHTIYRHPWIYLSSEERLKAMPMLKGLRRPVILLNPGAVYGSAKRWPAEHFSNLAMMIIREMGGSVVLTSSAEESFIVDCIVGKMDMSLINDETVLNLSGKTALRELTSLLSQIDLVVTNDSGPMHLAYAVGTPLISIFGSTDPLLTGPPSSVHPEKDGFVCDSEFGLRDVVLKREIKCSPCFERECPRGDLICLKEITPDDVFREIQNILPTHKAIFFDRDGTLCRDVHYLNSMDNFHIFPDIEILRGLKERGFFLIGVSNQSGIAKGWVEEGFNERINNIFIQQYKFDGFYYCPHAPTDNCACRKPSPGMAFKARSDFNIDLKSSIVVGDKEVDMEFGKNINAETILVKTGEALSSKYADKICENLKEVVKYILDK